VIRPTLTLSAYHVPPLASYPRQTRPPLVWRRSFVILLTASTIRVADLFESSLRGSPAGPQRPTASAFPTRSSAAAVWTTNPRPPWPRAPHPCHRGTEELEGQGGLPVVVFARALEAPPPKLGVRRGRGGEKLARSTSRTSTSCQGATTAHHRHASVLYSPESKAPGPSSVLPPGTRQRICRGVSSTPYGSARPPANTSSISHTRRPASQGARPA